MQVIEKYLIVALLIIIQTVIGLLAPDNFAKMTEKGSYITRKNDENKPVTTMLNIKPNTGTNSEMSDSLHMDSKIWMLKQNIIIGY